MLFTNFTNLKGLAMLASINEKIKAQNQKDGANLED
jgi:hypothetical protein